MIDKKTALSLVIEKLAPDLPTALLELSEEVDPDDHYNRFTTVFKAPDGRLWEMFYEADGQGNYNSWRDGDASDPVEVEAYQVTATRYRKKTVD